MKVLKIGNLKFKNRLFLAPMVDVTDLPYRLICREAGASMAYTEMIYVNAILHKNTKTIQMMKTCRFDSPLGIQITGNQVSEFEKVIPLVKNYDLIDLNCGCPSSRIIGNKAGSYLMKDPKKIFDIVRVLKKSGKPITVKMRLGFDKINVLEVAKLVERAGAEAITIHARLGINGNEVPADWTWIKKVKKAVSIPVIGNGDIFNENDAEKMLEICDGAMIGRAAIGDPLIFFRIESYLKKREKEEFNLLKNLECFQKYLKLSKKYDLVNIARIKYLGGKFIRGFEGAGDFRNNLIKLNSVDDIYNLIEKIKTLK